VGRFLAVIFLFAMGLMCKPMIVTLPCVLLLLDYWPLKRLFLPSSSGGDSSSGVSVNWRAVVEKLPLLALSLAVGVAAMMGPKTPWIVEGERIPFFTRMSEAPVWLAIYLVQMIWPAGLAVVYTHYEASLRWAPAALASLGALSLGFYALRGKHPYLWMGWLWNIGMLMPVLGFLQITRHSRADHYTYLPQIGLYIGLTWTAADWAAERVPRRAAMGAIAAAALILLTFVAWRQTTYWHDSITLWTHALECTRDNYVAQTNLGSVLLQQGRIGEAVEDLRAAVRVDPDQFDAQYNLGLALFQQGRTQEAIDRYLQALQLNPASDQAHRSLGDALLRQGKTDDAIFHYRAAMRINPDDADNHNALGNALSQQGWPQEALTEYREAVRLDPADADAQYNLGVALSREGRTQQAIDHYRAALRVNPAFEGTHDSLGNALFQEGRIRDAIIEYRAALQINPAYAPAHNNLGTALLREGQTAEAIQHFQKALDLKPGNVAILNNLASVLATAKQISLRNGARAVQLALQARQSSGSDDPDILRTLAAAYAEEGKYRDAIQTAQSALQDAETAELAAKLRRDIKLYETERPLPDGQ
jgi:tetratricopeptide (TPR) repeat protein